MNQQTQLEIGGRTLKVETGHVAQQASGAVTVRMGDTMLLVTATMSATPRRSCVPIWPQGSAARCFTSTADSTPWA